MGTSEVLKIRLARAKKMEEDGYRKPLDKDALYGHGRRYEPSGVPKRFDRRKSPKNKDALDASGQTMPPRFARRHLLFGGILVSMLAKKIREDMTTAMKAKDPLRLDTLRGALAAFTNELVAKGKKPTDEVDDALAVSVLKRLAKQRKDSIEQFIKGGRKELADKESAELKILEGYLPQSAGREEIEKVVRAKVVELGVTDKSGAGKLTGVVMKEFAGRADGGDVKEIINTLLGSA